MTGVLRRQDARIFDWGGAPNRVRRIPLCVWWTYGVWKGGIARNSADDGLVSNAGTGGMQRTVLGFFQAQSWPVSVVGKELDAGVFEGGANCGKGPRVRMAGTPFKVNKRSFRDRSAFRKFSSRPT